MKKNFQKMIIAMLVFVANVFAKGGIGDINVCTNVCAGNNISCKNQYLNCGSSNAEEGGLSDLLNSAVDASQRFYDWKSTKDVRSEDLGLVKNEMLDFTTTFPATGQKKIVSFTPSKGLLAGKKVSVMFVSFDLMSKRYPKNTPKNLMDALDEYKSENNKHEVQYVSMVRIFGRIEGTANGLWYDAGSIDMNIKPDMKGFEIKMEVNGDGEIVINDNELLDQTGADGSKARIAPIQLDFAKVPEMIH